MENYNLDQRKRKKQVREWNWEKKGPEIAKDLGLRRRRSERLN
jgi:hypothetical protein